MMHISLNRRGGAGAMLGGALCVLACVAPSAMADTVRYGGITYKDVEIRGFSNGSLVITMPSGVERALPLSVIESLSIDKYPQMSEADALMVVGKFSEAADLLAPVFEGAEEKHVQLLAGAKWVNCLDLGGHWADCVGAFIAYLGVRPGDLADGVAPQNLPVDVAERQKLAAVVSEELEGAFDLRTKKLLGELLERLNAEPTVNAAGVAGVAGVVETPEAPEGVARGSATPSANLRTIANGPVATVDEVDELLQAGQTHAALKLVNTLIEERAGSLSKRLYQRGLCEAKLGHDKDAALAFMRVVVHYNARTSIWYVKSLIGAAESLERVGQIEHARTLLNEAVSTTKGDDAKKADHEKANELLGKL